MEVAADEEANVRNQQDDPGQEAVKPAPSFFVEAAEMVSVHFTIFGCRLGIVDPVNLLGESDLYHFKGRSGSWLFFLHPVSSCAVRNRDDHFFMITTKRCLGRNQEQDEGDQEEKFAIHNVDFI